MTNTSPKQQRARRESDVLDDVSSKPEIKKNGYFKQCQFFSFLFLLGLYFASHDQRVY